MKIVRFQHEHINRAIDIIKAEYEEERVYVPALQTEVTIPDLTHFADNQMGMAAFDGDTMLGFLCAYKPMEDAFGTTGIRGTFSPIHAHGVLKNQELKKIGKDTYSRERIYSLLYQEAGKLWSELGILNHAVALFAHDKEAENSFFFNGFGLRCIDAVRLLDQELTPVNEILSGENPEYCELIPEQWKSLLKYHNDLISHLGESPTFMRFPPIDEQELYRRTSEDTRYFAVKYEGRYIAYIKIGSDGENFATESPSMMNICGAFCSMEYRGTGIFHNLLSFLISTLRKEGYTRLGVDFESFNPTARGFWLKYFTAYTHSVVRHIDDKIVL